MYPYLTIWEFLVSFQEFDQQTAERFWSTKGVFVSSP
jgi:hypothetical protein